MKYRFSLWIAIVALISTIVACGGSGPGTPPIDSTVYVSVRAEAVLASTGAAVDASNIFTGEQIQFRLTGVNSVDTAGPRVVIPNTTWRMTGTPGGTLSSSGVFTAGGSAGTSNATVTSTYQSNDYSLLTRVVAPQAVIRGRGRITDGRPAARIQVLALNSSGSIVATGNVASDGTIRMSVPTNATRLTTDFSGVDPSATFYVRQFFYNGFDYSTVINSCTAPLPTGLTNGVTTNLASDIVFYLNSGGPPPPPPSGCN
jgi:hypothetical protein